MATHSSILAWKIPLTEQPGGLQSIGSQKVRHDLLSKHLSIYLFIHPSIIYPSILPSIYVSLATPPPMSLCLFQKN